MEYRACIEQACGWVCGGAGILHGSVDGDGCGSADECVELRVGERSCWADGDAGWGCVMDAERGAGGQRQHHHRARDG